jgi:hypothetical protein
MTSTMRFDKWENSLGQPYGTVLQVVTASSSTAVTSTANAFISTGLVATITPKFINSIIVISSTFPLHNNSTGSAGVWTLFRGNVSTGTNLGTVQVDSANPGFFQVYSASSAVRTSGSIFTTDSPSILLPVTYTVAFNSVSGNAVTMHEDRKGSITLMEIAQ